MSDYDDLVQQMLKDSMTKRHNAVEEMAERMLTTPDSPGISVQTTWSRADFSCSTETRLNPDVPFGEIHYLPDVYL